MLKTAICDGERLHRNRTAELTEKILDGRGADISCYDGADALLSAVDAGYTPDIAILDIEMGENRMDGISLAERLNHLVPACRIIFVTSYLAFATDVYRTEHTYFILKSELEERLGDALAKAAAALGTDFDSDAVLAVKTRGATACIPVRDVKYVERLGRKTHIVTAASEFWSSQSASGLMSGRDGQFIRCHQSIWVNPAYISAMKSDEFQLFGGDAVPISRSFRQSAREQFFASLRRPLDEL